MEIGIDSFGAVISDPDTGLTLSSVQRTRNLLEEIALADKVGLDVFAVGEHHRSEFVDSAPVVILAAAAARTQKIRLTSAVTVLSAADQGPPSNLMVSRTKLNTGVETTVRAKARLDLAGIGPKLYLSTLSVYLQFMRKDWVWGTPRASLVNGVCSSSCFAALVREVATLALRATKVEMPSACDDRRDA